MKKINSTYMILIVFAISIISCKSEPAETVTYMAVPDGLNSSKSSIYKANNGDIYLSWIENDKDTTSLLKFSTLNGTSWSVPKTIAQGNDWFVNWADFPSITSFGTSNLVAHYLEKSANDTYAYDVKLIQSTDNGDTWNEAFSPHSDSTNTEHGFVSKMPLSNDTYLSVWLDGRQNAYAEADSSFQKQMSLRSAVFNTKGELIEEHLLDNRVCDCCQTDVAMTNEGPIVVYRDRSENEIRDTYYVKNINGQWTQPKPISNDNWHIAGCPVNGPAIATNGDYVATTWFTAADNIPKVNIAFSTDNGNTFGDPITVGSASVMGRLDIEILDDGSAIVSFLDSLEGESAIILQHIKQDGTMSEPFPVSETSGSRSSGFPRMVKKDDLIYLTWTEVGDELHAKTAAISLDALMD